jgi:probable addiction module antidote protein
MALDTHPFDAARTIETAEDAAVFLRDAMEEGDPAAIAQALGTIARARGMTDVAKAAGLGREGLYKALGQDGNPGFATVVKVMQALDLKLGVVPAGREAETWWLASIERVMRLDGNKSYEVRYRTEKFSVT